MKRPILTACAASVLIALSGFVAGQFLNRQAPMNVAALPVQGSMVQLANGSIVYQEKPDPALVNLQDIAPAGGGDDEAKLPHFQYDPLTQTYRAQTVDIEGNSRQDIIHTNK